MTPALSPALGVLRRHLRDFVSGDLRGVRLAVATDLPGEAFAYGDLVVLSPTALRRAPRALLALVVHELVHVFQQRAGRTAPHTAGVVIDPTLEAEADATADRVTRGERVHLSAPARRVRRPVLQPKLLLGGATVANTTDISPKVRALTALIPQADAWLAQAIARAEPVFAFADEPALVAGVAQGLQGVVVQQLPAVGLTCDLSVLCDLGDTDFENVVTACQVGQLSPEAVAALARQRIHTDAEFARIAALTTSLTPDVPIAGATLEARCLWLETVGSKTEPDRDLAPAAAAFARTRSNSLPAFAAAWNFFYDVSPRFSAASEAEAHWDALVPYGLPLLSCPVIDPSTPNDALLARIAALVATERIGFATLNHAVANLGAHASVPRPPSLDPAAAEQAVAAYFQSQAAIIPSGAATVRRVQDGVTRWITCDGPEGRAVCQLDASGHLTLLELAPA